MLIFWTKLHSEDRWTDFNAWYLKKRVTAGSAYQLGSKQQFHNFRGQNPQNSQKLAGIGILQPNPRSRKPAIYPSPMKLLASNLTYRLKTGINIQNLPNYVKWGHVGSSDPLLEFWDPPPLISPERLKLETSNVIHRWMAVSRLLRKKMQN